MGARESVRCRLDLCVFFSHLETLLSYFLWSSIFLNSQLFDLLFFSCFGFFLSLLVWLLVPYLSGFISFELGFLFLLVRDLVFIPL